MATEAIPGYKIRSKLGTGGTAAVFLAEDTGYHNRLVALKILHPTKTREPEALRRFLREAKLLIEFSHPHIVKGYDLGNIGSLSFFTMEYIEGVCVQNLIDKNGALPEAHAIEVTLALARALEYMQSKGIVHRDIKPDNILLDKKNVVKLCDLGFAQPMADGRGATETTSGTVQYMSPEQAMGQRDLDIRSDIYSLGATLYHMLMGKAPFTGTDSLEVMAKQVRESLNSAEVKNRRVSTLALYFVERMMAKEKDLRYASPTELIEDISAQLEGFKSLQFDARKEDTKIPPKRFR